MDFTLWDAHVHPVPNFLEVYCCNSVVATVHAAGNHSSVIFFLVSCAGTMDKRRSPTTPASCWKSPEGAATASMYVYIFMHILAIIAAVAVVFAVMVYDNTFQIGMNRVVCVFGRVWWGFFLCEYIIHIIIFVCVCGLLLENPPVSTAPKGQPPLPPTPHTIPAKTFPVLDISKVYILYAVLAMGMHYGMYLVKFGEGNIGAPRALALVLSAFCAALAAPISAAAFRNLVCI